MTTDEYWTDKISDLIIKVELLEQRVYDLENWKESKTKK